MLTKIIKLSYSVKVWNFILTFYCIKKVWGELSMGIRLENLVVKFGDFNAIK